MQAITRGVRFEFTLLQFDLANLNPKRRPGTESTVTSPR